MYETISGGLTVVTPDSPLTLAGRPAPAGIAITEEWDAGLSSSDPLAFPGYEPPVAGDESVRTGTATLCGRPVAVVHCRFDVQGGTMGAVAGERIVRAFSRATDLRIPLVEYVA